MTCEPRPRSVLGPQTSASPRSLLRLQWQLPAVSMSGLDSAQCRQRVDCRRRQLAAKCGRQRPSAFIIDSIEMLCR
jgi:hypothetical protein